MMEDSELHGGQNEGGGREEEKEKKTAKSPRTQ